RLRLRFGRAAGDAGWRRRPADRRAHPEADDARVRRPDGVDRLREDDRWGRLTCGGCRRSRGGWPLRHRPRRSRARGPHVRGRPGLTMTSPALPSIWFERPVLPELVEVAEASCSVLGTGTELDRSAGHATRAVGIAGS